MTGPPKRKARAEPGSSKLPPRFSTLWSACQSFEPLALVKILRLVQSPFGWVFWLLEQRLAKIEDHLANERIEL